MSKLADIKKAVKAYQYANTREQQAFEKFVNIDVYMYWLISLLAVHEAAKEVSQSLNENGATVGTYKRLSKLDDALAKLEGE